jgi:hypothetical protein
MRDSSIRDPVKLQQTEEILKAFQEQNEWYRLNAGNSLCDCSNCINARKRKSDGVADAQSVKQIDRIHRRSLFYPFS